MGISRVVVYRVGVLGLNMWGTSQHAVLGQNMLRLVSPLPSPPEQSRGSSSIQGRRSDAAFWNTTLSSRRTTNQTSPYMVRDLVQPFDDGWSRPALGRRKKNIMCVWDNQQKTHIRPSPCPKQPTWDQNYGTRPTSWRAPYIGPLSPI